MESIIRKFVDATCYLSRKDARVGKFLAASGQVGKAEKLADAKCKPFFKSSRR